MAMQIRDYEERKYAHWVAETEFNLPLLMKKPILVMITTENQIQAELVFISHYLLTYNCCSVFCKNTYTVTILILFFFSQIPCLCFDCSHFQAVSKDVPPTESSLQRNVRYLVNFAPEIREIISETHNLVALGCSVPYLAQNVTLQEHKLIR